MHRVCAWHEGQNKQRFFFLDSTIWLVLAVKAQCALGEAETKFLRTVPYINVKLKRIIFVCFHCVHIRVEGIYRAKSCSEEKTFWSSQETV